MTTLSFEFFPPKTPEQEAHLFEALGQLKQFKPDFASVTCGALGTNQDKTFYWVKQIKERFAITPVAHLTCVGISKSHALERLNELDSIGVNNVLALRGDPPSGEEKFVPPADGFKSGRELVAFIKKNKPHFRIGVAGYPEGHRESPSLALDTQYLKEKVEAGADYIISQLFFVNRFFFDFVDRCRKAGIRVPIIPGIMPITSLKQIKRMTEMCGATIPEDLLKKLEVHGDDKTAVEKVGEEQTILQCRELLGTDIHGLHFFVMNQAGPISKILKELKFDRRR